MNIDDLSQMTTTLLAISLASERLVTVLKTIFPSLLAIERKDDLGNVDLKADQPRRLVIIVLSIITSWLTAAFLSDGKFKDGVFQSDNQFDLLGYIILGQKNHFPVVLMGLLASGGSALWGNFLEYTKAVKDIQTQRKATEALNFRNTALQQVSFSSLQTGGLTTQKFSAAGQSLQDVADKLTAPNLSTITESRVKRA